jgi:MATE family multidrug resistance protein
MQFVTFSAFFLDGFALAAETLVGAAVGASNRAKINQSIRYVFELGIVTASLLSCFFWLGGEAVISLLTNIESVRDSTAVFIWWAIFAPIVSVWCYLLDGVFIGATKTPEMRNAMLASLIAFLGMWWLVTPQFGNHGLWLALYCYFIARTISLGYYLPGLIRDHR